MPTPLSDVTALNPVEQIDQLTAFVLAPVCLRCGYGGLSQRRDSAFRCDGCHRIVTMIEYAPATLTRTPERHAASRIPH